MPKKKTNKMPAILFYTGDWLKDPAVRCCSLEARGLWIEMLCLMYESPKRGYLALANGEPPTSVQLSRMVGASHEDIERLTDELRACCVFSETNDGIIYSRRMVSDELIRADKSKAGKKGMEARYNKTDNTTDNTEGNKPETALEYEYENETVNSSNNYLLSRRSREKSESLDFVLNAIPKNRLQNPSKTKMQIRRVLDVAVSNGMDEMESAKKLAERFISYYESEEGRGEYFKTPHKWLEEDCHLVDPSVWNSRKKDQPKTGWHSIKKG